MRRAFLGCGHARRVAVYAALTAQRIGLDRAAVARIRRAAALHDIGKVEVPHQVLRLPRRLAAEERALVQSHAIAGARIVAVADTFDAVTSERPYRPALEQPRALELLDREAGAQLDPEVVAAFDVHCSGLRGVLMSVQRS